MSYPEEVHPWTVAWFQTLPQSYQMLDAGQKNPPMQLWDGLNQAPFDVTVAGGWSTDYEDEARRAVFQGFAVSPGEKVHYQIWVKPNQVPGGSLMVTVFDTLSNQPVTVIGHDQLTNVTSPEELAGYFYPPLHGQFVVYLSLNGHDPGAGPVPGSHPVVDAVSISKRHVTYGELPRKAPNDTQTCHPLLRFMDGIGQIGGRYRELSDQLWDGHFTNPETCSDGDLPWLAQMLGIHRRIYRNLEYPDLRALIRNTASQGLAAMGSRAGIAEIVRPFLTGEQKVSVGPHPSLKHVIRVKVRVDEIPDKDLARLAATLQTTGTIPAGHQIIVEDGVDTVPTWAQWEAAAGTTWAELEARAPRWTDADILGSPD